MVSCRFSYVYPDGPAPYYTVLGQGRPGSELEQWAEIKAAASDALIAAGVTITHHYAVGRYHRPWYITKSDRHSWRRRMVPYAERSIPPAS